MNTMAPSRTSIDVTPFQIQNDSVASDTKMFNSDRTFYSSKRKYKGKRKIIRVYERVWRTPERHLHQPTDVT